MIIEVDWNVFILQTSTSFSITHLLMSQWEYYFLLLSNKLFKFCDLRHKWAIIVMGAGSQEFRQDRAEWLNSVIQCGRPQLGNVNVWGLKSHGSSFTTMSASYWLENPYIVSLCGLELLKTWRLGSENNYSKKKHAYVTVQVERTYLLVRDVSVTL